MTDLILSEAERLYHLGFAIHWIKPKSKMPVEAKWTTGPRASFAHLKKTYRPGFNIGVRLGEASKVKEGFLAVIDFDIKSDKPEHLESATARLRELFPGAALQGPYVMSGRGNGSAHYYAVTNAPISSRKLASSGELVKVLMPSTAPSSKHKGLLTPDEVKAGWRLRPAWEIELMSIGRQVVLPPSIHPDTGEKYRWGGSRHPCTSGEAFPVITMPGVEKKSAARNRLDDFEAEEVDLIDTEVEPRIIAAITQGKGVEDRSASLFAVSIAMVRAGLTDNQILSVLTDTGNYLGQTAYDHAQTDSRARAAEWVFNYTLKRARRESDAALVFDTEVVVEEPLSEEATRAQERELLGDDWRSKLERTKEGKLKSTLKNILLILNGTAPGVFIRNEFSNRDFYGRATPWGGVKNRELKDEDAIFIKRWFAERFGIEPSVGLIFEAMTCIAKENGFHPVRDYLNGLTWDGVERIDGWLKRYLEATGPEPYLSAVSRKTLCAMVARVFQPGCKYDHLLILEGRQGVGKSTAARILAGEAWFSDTLPDVRDKDAMLNLLGAWVVEVSELATLKRADSETYKAFFTRQTDRVRAPYGRRWEEFPRQCIFIGTTNTSDYLKDKTGNRRFWPVEVGACDFKGLARDRDQLLAEAKWVWENLGEELYLVHKEKEQAELVQASRVAEDEESIMLADMRDWVVRQSVETGPEKFDFGGFRLLDLFNHPGCPFSRWTVEYPHPQWAASVLKNLGFENYNQNGHRKWRIKKEA